MGSISRVLKLPWFTYFHVMHHRSYIAQIKSPSSHSGVKSTFLKCASSTRTRLYDMYAGMEGNSVDACAQGCLIIGDPCLERPLFRATKRVYIHIALDPRHEKFVFNRYLQQVHVPGCNSHAEAPFCEADVNWKTRNLSTTIAQEERLLKRHFLFLCWSGHHFNEPIQGTTLLLYNLAYNVSANCNGRICYDSRISFIWEGAQSAEFWLQVMWRYPVTFSSSYLMVMPVPGLFQTALLVCHRLPALLTLTHRCQLLT